MIVASPFLAEKSSQLSIAKQRDVIHYIPYGISMEHFLPDNTQDKVKQLRAQFSQRFLVFALGRHVTYKGLPQWHSCR